MAKTEFKGNAATVHTEDDDNVDYVAAFVAIASIITIMTIGYVIAMANVDVKNEPKAENKKCICKE